MTDEQATDEQKQDEQQKDEERQPEGEQQEQPEDENRSGEGGGDDDAAAKARRASEEEEEAKEKVKELEEDPPEKLEDWPDDKAKYETFGGAEGDESYEDSVTSKLGPSSLRFKEDGGVEIEGEEVDDPDEYKGDPIPGGPTDPRVSDSRAYGEPDLVDETSVDPEAAGEDGGGDSESSDSDSEAKSESDSDSEGGDDDDRK